MRSTIVWFRRGLRISDHAPLHRAVSRLPADPIVKFGCAALFQTPPMQVAFMLECYDRAGFER